MAEVLGVVASGISIGSLAIQLVDSLQKIHRFWRLIDGAPKDIGDTIEELQVLGIVFSELLNQPERIQSSIPLPSNSVRVCLQHFCKVQDDLRPIVLKLHSDFLGSKHQKWASIKSALRKEEVQDLTQRLERSKSTLGLAVDSYKLLLQQQQIALQQQQTAFQQQQIAFQQEQTDYRQEQIAWQQQQSAQLTQLLSMAQQDSGSITVSSRDASKSGGRLSATEYSTPVGLTTKCLTHVIAKRIWIGIGWYHYQSRERADHLHTHPPSDRISQSENDDKDIERSYFPAPWFSSRGFSFRTARIWGTWQYSFRLTRVVSHLRPIFGAICNGDFPLIIELLENREATIYDTDDHGWNLLHYAARCRQHKLCQWLIEQGVAGDAAHDGRTPLHALTCRWDSDRNYSTDDFLNTARVLIEQGQHDPMAVDVDKHTPIHYYRGPPEGIVYIANQQNHFYVDLEQRDDGNFCAIAAMLLCMCSINISHGLQLTKHLLETGRVHTDSTLISCIIFVLRLSKSRSPPSGQLSIPDLLEIDDLIDWLADLINMLGRRQQRLYLPDLVRYYCELDETPFDFEEDDKTPLIRLWLAILRKAGINLHDHFRDMEETLDQHEVKDDYRYRQGIKRELRVEYGPHPDEVTILVRDVLVEIPAEDCMPGAWQDGMEVWGKTECEPGLIVKGLKPTANWRVSSKDEDDTGSWDSDSDNSGSENSDLKNSDSEDSDPEDSDPDAEG